MVHGLKHILDDLGRITIPKEIRERLGWQEGDLCSIAASEDRIIIQQIPHTYGDSLRLMSDEELAAFLVRWSLHPDDWKRDAKEVQSWLKQPLKKEK